MNLKAQIAALFAAAALGGATATVIANPSRPMYRVHALDLRMTPAADGGTNITMQVWADKRMPDGSWKDLGAGQLIPVNQPFADALIKSAEAAIHE